MINLIIFSALLTTGEIHATLPDDTKIEARRRGGKGGKKRRRGEMASDSKGARSYKGQIIGDSMSVTINFKWLIQLVIFVAMVVYGWWQLESRIQELERNMVLALEEIELHEAERKHAEKAHVTQMEERMLWYESELNLNPFSWGKKNKK